MHRVHKPVRLAGLAVLTAAAACVPDTQLQDERPGGSGKAGVELLVPAPGSSDVPPNLAAVMIRLPAPGITVDGLLRVRKRNGGGGAAPAGPLEPAACAGGGECRRLPLTAPLDADTPYLVELLPGARGPDGTAPPPGPAGEFVTAPVPDHVPPAIDVPALEAQGPCVRVRFGTDEPVDAELVLGSGPDQRVLPVGFGASAFDTAVWVAGLLPGGEAELLVRVADRAGNRAEAAAWVGGLPTSRPVLVITEVLANAAGTEPAQELVELFNTGEEPVEMKDLRLEDGSGFDDLPPAQLSSRAYAIVVPSTYDAASPLDQPPHPGTVLVRVDARLGADGLANGGEPVKLPGPSGELISSYGGWVNVSASAWSGKGVHRLSADACDVPAGWSQKPLASTPGGPPP